MIDQARHRLEVLAADTVTESQRDIRRITATERTDLILILGELHRLNVAVSEQRKALERRLTAKKRPHPKPQDARTPTPAARNTRQKAAKTKGKS